MVFENRVLRRIFESKRDEVTGEWRKYIMTSLGICTPPQYCSGDQIEKVEMDGARSMYGGEERRIQDFGGKISEKEATWKAQALMGG